MGLVRIYLSGRVAIEGSHVVGESDLPGPLGRVLLAVLALNRSPVARQRLAEILWDEEPPQAYERSLNPLLSKLRRSLVAAGAERDILVSGAGAVELRRASDVWIDLEEATTALDRAEGLVRAGRPREAWPQAAVATSILGRPFMEGVELRWVEEQRRVIEARLVRAFEAVVDVWMGLDDPAQAGVAARKLVAVDRFRETSYERLIRAHLAQGNRAEALRAFAECERVLRDELGVAPSELVQAAYQEALET